MVQKSCDSNPSAWLIVSHKFDNGCVRHPAISFTWTLTINGGGADAAS
jgi:hypothetical protein